MTHNFAFERIAGRIFAAIPGQEPKLACRKWLLESSLSRTSRSPHTLAKMIYGTH
jgi:hypothetical protein